MMVFSPEHLKSFKEKGYFILPQVISTENLQKIEVKIAKIVADRSTNEYYEVSTLDSSKEILVRIEQFIDVEPQLKDLILSSVLTSALNQVLGEPPVLFKDKINFKLPGMRADRLHQDHQSHWGQYGSYFVTAALALDSCTKENGCLNLYTKGDFQGKFIGENWRPLQADGMLPEDFISFEAEPGDVVIFDWWVPHYSDPNHSDRSRRMLFLTFNRESEGDNRKRYYADKIESYPPNALREQGKVYEYKV